MQSGIARIFDAGGERMAEIDLGAATPGYDDLKWKPAPAYAIEPPVPVYAIEAPAIRDEEEPTRVFDGLPGTWPEAWDCGVKTQRERQS